MVKIISLIFGFNFFQSNNGKKLFALVNIWIGVNQFIFDSFVTFLWEKESNFFSILLVSKGSKKLTSIAFNLSIISSCFLTSSIWVVSSLSSDETLFNIDLNFKSGFSTSIAIRVEKSWLKIILSKSLLVYLTSPPISKILVLVSVLKS